MFPPSKTAKRYFLSSLLMVLILGHAASNVFATVESNQVLLKRSRYYRLRGGIIIFYDPSDILLQEVASDICKALDVANVSSTLMQITCLDELDEYLKNGDVWIAIYLFNTNVKYVIVGGEAIEWQRFAELLLRHKHVEHILGIGNTRSLAMYVAGKPNIHIADGEVIDAKLTFLYSVWAVAEILQESGIQYEKAELGIRRFGLKYFAENFGDLFERSLTPKASLGEEDLERKQKEWEDVEKRFPKYMRKLPPLPPDRSVFDENVTYNTEAATLQKPTRLTLFSEHKPASTSGSAGGDLEEILKLLDIPLKSGLDGPVGTVVDFFIETLLGEGVSAVGIDPAVFDQIKTLIEAINTIIGIVEGAGEKSPLEAIFDIVKEQFPFLENYTKYFDLFIDAMYALRDPDKILDVVLEILDLVFPETGGVINNIKDALKDILDIGSGLYDAIKNYEKVYDALLSWFNQKILPKIVDKFLDEAAGTITWSAEEIENGVSKIVAVVNSVIDFVVSENVTTLLTNLGETVLSAFDIVDSTVVNRIKALIDLATVVLGYSKPLRTVLQEIATAFLPGVPVPNIQNLAEQVYSEIDKAVKEGISQVQQFRNNIENYINSAVGAVPINSALKTALRDAIVLAAGVMNKKFDKSQLPTLKNVLDTVLDVAGLSGLKNTIDKTVTHIMRIVAIFKDDDSIKQIISQTASQFNAEYGSPKKIVKELVEFVLQQVDPSIDLGAIADKIDTVATVGRAVFDVLKKWKENTVQGILQTILEGVGFAIVNYYPSDLNLDVYAKILEIAFPQVMGITEPPTPDEAVEIVMEVVGSVSPEIEEVISTTVRLIAEIDDIFSDGLRWIFNQVMDWLSGKVDELIDKFLGEVSGLMKDHPLEHWEGEYELGIGGFSAFGVRIELQIDAGIGIDSEELFRFISDMIFDGYDWEKGSVGDIFKRVISFLEIIPTFTASLEIGQFGSKKNSLMDFLMETLGMQLTFSGGAHVSLQLFSFKGGAFDTSGFMKVVEWGFYFEIQLKKEFTLLDFLTCGVGGGALNAIAEFLGLDSIKIGIFFGIRIEIIKRAASPTGPEEGTMTLQITIGVELTIPINLLIVSISFYGSLKIVFTFIQDLVGGEPMKIFMDLILYIEVTISLLFVDIEASYGPATLYHHDFTTGSRDEAKSKASEENMNIGFDSDGDGLSDDYESRVPGLNASVADTDGDGLNDKEETQTTKTDPTKSDTDGDGLNDKEEIYTYMTNPKRPDTDSDGLTDYEEVKIYGTNPRVMDTDQDALDDLYEVRHAWDISNCTTSVHNIMIGGVPYNDHTDPLNPDTDNDGLLDGEEGPAGPYYGLSKLYNGSAPGVDASPLIFNYGYTHPLDNDTDDDSYLQLWNGSIAPVYGGKQFLRSMTDGEEVKGIWVTFITEGEPNRTLIRTNPCNPDTDGDTGRSPGAPVTIDKYLNSDGYELSLNPPTDPTDGDTDDDGLIDGLEGFLNPYPYSYHTDGNNPDTDMDGLGDMQEVLLKTDPRNPDSDFDQVSDGDEYHRFHTSPFLADSDYDGLNDGEEVWTWHTNPNLRDSDGDGICDGQEVLKYNSDPMDEDTDNDGLNDYDEIFKYLTDPFSPDTDGDGLLDGYEATVTQTDPLKWDTDADSIWYPNELGEMTWPMSDGDEVLVYHTNPLFSDTDHDGISDSMELYLASGKIPSYVLAEPIPLDPLCNDTDHDGLLDGVELGVENTTDIVYPYVSFKLISPYNTSAVNPDTDGDGLSDFEEVTGTLTGAHVGLNLTEYGGSLPNVADSDNDFLSDYDEVFVCGTNPLMNDTDGDGLLDGFEITLAGAGSEESSQTFYVRGIMPLGTPNASFSFSPAIPNASQTVSFNATTSYDLNGTIVEYRWNFGDETNATTTGPIITHIYPFCGAYAVNLTVIDNDGMNSTATGTVVVRYLTSALDSDSDDDKAPDGYEVSEIRVTTFNASYTEIVTITGIIEEKLELHYAVNPIYNVTEVKPVTDPMNPHTVNPSILDGDLYDLDHDGVSDGDEFYTDKTWQGMFYKPSGSFEVGGFINPDSDGDGLSDGVEVHDLHTSPVNPDTDGDGYTDGAEVAAKTDPLETTTPDEYAQALERLRAGMTVRIIYPTNTTVTDTTADVRVLNSTAIQTMWFRYDSGTGWSNNYTMQYDAVEEQWENTTISWGYGSYHLQVFAITTEGFSVWDEEWFTVAMPPSLLPPAPWPLSLLNWWQLIVLGLVIGVIFASAAFLATRRRKGGGKS